MRTRTQHSLLVEVMIALLFFALSATVILQVMVTARDKSEEAGLLSRALVAAQSAADDTWAGATPGEREEAGNGFTLRITVTEEQTGAGVWRTAEVTALDDAQKALFSLPCSRYIPGEVSAP